MFGFDPFAPFDTRLMRPLARPGFLAPADVAVSENEMILTMDLPGMTADDLEIEVLDNHLVVRGERRRPELTEGSAWVHAERAVGPFERRIRLPEGIDPDAVVANMDNGVLSLIVPKPDRMRPRTIEIGTGTGQRQLNETT